MHSVKVDNVINEFQMLANSQFVENRVYDEEVEDIMTNGQNLPIEETAINKNKDEEILSKIKIALNIGLDFMNERFNCVSNKVSQNDSDDENDEILEGLISKSARDEFSQRLLPYIIGSEDFIKDNYVGLSCVEESPAIDLKTRVDNDISVKSVENYDSNSDTFEIRTPPPIANNFIDDMNDSEEESNDLFGTVPRLVNNRKSSVSSDESDSGPFVVQNKDIPKPENKENKETKPTIPSMPSFQDELSAAISSKNPKKQLFVAKEDKEEEPEFAINKTQTKTPLTKNYESSSSDESDSIFNVNKTKPKSENNSKNNFSNLFGDQNNDNSLFDETIEKPKTKDLSNKVLPIPKQQISVKSSSLFDDDDDDEDDLFGAISKKPSAPSKPVIIEEQKSEKIDKIIENKKPILSNKNLFSDDEEDDDLFSGIASKSKQNNVQNSDAFEPIVKPTVSSVVNKQKPIDSLIGELSSALKKKKLFQSDDEESDSNSDDNFKTKKELKTQSEVPSETRTEKQINYFKTTIEDKNDSLFNDNDIKSSEVSANDVISENRSLDNDFYPEEPTSTLSNDCLKHKAILGAKRNRRPPTKKLLKLTPITDFSHDLESKPDFVPEEEEEEKLAPVATLRTVKITDSKPVVEEKEEEIKSEPKSDPLFGNSFKSMASLMKSPSTEEDDIFPTQTNISKNQNISKIFEKSENVSIGLFEDSGDNEESLFSSVKTNKTNVSTKVVDKRGLFDTSDSDDDNDFFGNKSSNVISNIIKPSNSELFNDVSSTDSSLSNKSDLKIGNSKPAVSLFSDSEDDDLFSAVTKSKANDKIPEKPTIDRNENLNKQFEKPIEKLKKSNSLFSDDDDDEQNSDLFDKKDIKTKTKSNVKPIFDLEDDDNDEGMPLFIEIHIKSLIELLITDIFSPKSSTTQSSNSSKKKTRKESQSSDLFDDPLFASRS